MSNYKIWNLHLKHTVLAGILQEAEEVGVDQEGAVETDKDRTTSISNAFLAKTISSCQPCSNLSGSKVIDNI